MSFSRKFPRGMVKATCLLQWPPVRCRTRSQRGRVWSRLMLMLCWMYGRSRYSEFWPIMTFKPLIIIPYDRLIDWLLERLIDWLIDWGLINWLIDWSFGRLIDCSIDWLIDWLIEELRISSQSGTLFVAFQGKKLFLLKNPWSHMRWKGNFSERDIKHWTPALKSALNYNPESAAQFDNGKMSWNFSALESVQGCAWP